PGAAAGLGGAGAAGGGAGGGGLGLVGAGAGGAAGGLAALAGGGPFELVLVLHLAGALEGGGEELVDGDLGEELVGAGLLVEGLLERVDGLGVAESLGDGAG